MCRSCHGIGASVSIRRAIVALPLVLRFRLAGRFVFAFKLSLAFLFAGFRFGLLSLVFVFVFELALLFSGFFQY